MKKINDGKCKLIFLLCIIFFVEFLNYFDQVQIKCHRNQKNQPAHAACAAKISQKKEENAFVARHVITKHATFATRHS